jgi:hypothetical protein
MTVAVMQPYIFPYVGYFQLVAAVDTFVFFDDVNFIMKGWINRNRILNNNEPLKFTIPLVKASQNRAINETELSEYPVWRKSFLRSVQAGYQKAPYFGPTYQWLQEFLARDFVKISDLAAESVKAVAAHLGLGTDFKLSSSLDYNREAGSGQEKILDICRLLGADRYINPRNGVELYDQARFSEAKVDLKFIHMQEIRFPQLNPDIFVPDLSIIDVLMFRNKEEIRGLLKMFTLN